MNWLTFALMTVASWGLYGIALHAGQTAMADKSNALYKSFLFVGLAYFLTAVLAPLGMLVFRKATWTFTPAGMSWSLIAGILGAIGAFCVLVSFAQGGKPGVVMSIVFAGAPVINAIASLILHPPPGGWSTLKPQFYLGIILAALGGYLVTRYKPAPTPSKPATVATIPGAPGSAGH
jgi:hypothetical protein